MSQFDWDAAARSAAQIATDTMMKVHRGTMPASIVGFSVAFGNDGYTIDERSRNEVEALRRLLAEAGVDVKGFGTSDDGYSWAMIVRTTELESLDDMIRSAAVEAGWNAGSVGLQGSIAKGVPPGIRPDGTSLN